MSSNFAHRYSISIWTYDEFAKEYYKKSITDNDVYVIVKEVIKVVNPKPGEIILEVGCGTGTIVYLLRQMGINAWGCDVSSLAISIAKKLYGNYYFQCDFVNAQSFTDRTYDKIYTLNSFLYVHPKDYEKVLRNLRRLLFRGGKLFLLWEPDYQKRCRYPRLLRRKRIYALCRLFTGIFSIHSTKDGSFYVKLSRLKKAAVRAGFTHVVRLDPVFLKKHVRSHYVLYTA